MSKSKAITKAKNGNGKDLMPAKLADQIRVAYGELVAASAAKDQAVTGLRDAHLRQIDAAQAVNALVGDTRRAAVGLAAEVA